MKKETFKLKTHIGQTVYEISIGVRSANSMHLSTTIDGHGIFVKKLKIVYYLTTNGCHLMMIYIMTGIN
jgi:hypothetical protein